MQSLCRGARECFASPPPLGSWLCLNVGCPSLGFVFAHPWSLPLCICPLLSEILKRPAVKPLNNRHVKMKEWTDYLSNKWSWFVLAVSVSTFRRLFCTDYCPLWDAGCLLSRVERCTLLGGSKCTTVIGRAIRSMEFIQRLSTSQCPLLEVSLHNGIVWAVHTPHEWIIGKAIGYVIALLFTKLPDLKIYALWATHKNNKSIEFGQKTPPKNWLQCASNQMVRPKGITSILVNFCWLS